MIYNALELSRAFQHGFFRRTIEVSGAGNQTPPKWRALYPAFAVVAGSPMISVIVGIGIQILRGLPIDLILLSENPLLLSPERENLTELTIENFYFPGSLSVGVDKRPFELRKILQRVEDFGLGAINRPRGSRAIGVELRDPLDR